MLILDREVSAQVYAIFINNFQYIKSKLSRFMLFLSITFSTSNQNYSAACTVYLFHTRVLSLDGEGHRFMLFFSFSNVCRLKNSLYTFVLLFNRIICICKRACNASPEIFTSNTFLCY